MIRSVSRHAGYFCAFLFLIFLPAGPAHASKLTPLVATALEFGGDTIVDLTYSDGSRSNIEAGRGLILGGGAAYEFVENGPNVFQIQGTLGVKWTSTKQATNGQVDFVRWPLELLLFYKNVEQNFRVGGGLTYQFGNELKGTQDASVVSTKLKNAAGLVLEGDYFLGAERNLSLGLRLTSIKYEPESFSASAVGNSLGVSFCYFWF